MVEATQGGISPKAEALLKTLEDKKLSQEEWTGAVEAQDQIAAEDVRPFLEKLLPESLKIAGEGKFFNTLATNIANGTMSPSELFAFLDELEQEGKITGVEIETEDCNVETTTNNTFQQQKVLLKRGLHDQAPKIISNQDLKNHLQATHQLDAEQVESILTMVKDFGINLSDGMSPDEFDEILAAIFSVLE